MGLGRQGRSARRAWRSCTPAFGRFPRQTGKTTLVQQLAPGRAYISLDENNYHRTAVEDPEGFIASLPDAVTLDEVQRAPALLPAIKRAVDRDRRPGRFLLTGSANLLLVPKVTESLAGRMEVAQLQPLTEAEKERKPGEFLRALLEGSLKPAIKGGTVAAEPGLAERLVAGGYPEALVRGPRRARQWHRQYLRGIVERDVQDIARVKDAQELARLLELLALRNAQLLNSSRLANDLGLHRETVDHYLAVLERLFLVRRLPAWHRNTAKRLVKSPKTHLLDSGLGAALGDLTATDWLDRRDHMGHLLESFVVQQLIAQAAWTDPGPAFLALPRQGSGRGRHRHDTGAEDLGCRSQGRRLVDPTGTGKGSRGWRNAAARTSNSGSCSMLARTSCPWPTNAC